MRLCNLRHISLFTQPRYEKIKELVFGATTEGKDDTTFKLILISEERMMVVDQYFGIK